MSRQEERLRRGSLAIAQLLSLVIKEKGRESEEAAQVQSRLAYMLANSNQLVEARELFLRSLELSSQKSGPDSMEVAGDLIGVGVIMSAPRRV